MAENTPTRCDQCGQVDDHPKVHLARVLGADPDGDGINTVHHDCLSYSDEQMVRTGAGGEHVGKIIDAAKGGRRGDNLRTLIESLHQEG